MLISTMVHVYTFLNVDEFMYCNDTILEKLHVLIIMKFPFLGM